jgi:adenylate kinase
MPLDIVMLGPPGAGKGTQARRLGEDLGIPHVATGDMVRAAIAAGSELGARVREIYDRGDLVPDDLMIEVVRDRLAEADAHDGFILDGFPRTLPQAEALDGVLGELGRDLTVVFDFQIPEEVAIERLLGRARQEGRTDDTPEVVHYRLEVYRAQTEPLVEYYRAKGIVVGIHAGRAIGEVYAEIQQAIDQADAA